jgi:PKD repeat protein
VPGLSGITAVSTGHYHSLALTQDGRVWAWGFNASGQLGDGTRTTRTSPIQVQGIADAVAIAAGRDMSYAVRSNGTVWAWGLNGDGQLGDGTTTDRLTPVRVGALTGIVSVSGGRDHGLAVGQDGSVWAWGWNAYGQVGNGTLTDRLVPVRVIPSGVVAVAGGAHHSYALRADGTVQSWGRNYRAELADGTTTDRLTPVQVLGVTGAVSIGSGRDHGLAVLGSGAVKAWGSNSSGQLGDGTTVNRSRAVDVPGITDASKVGGGGEGHSVVLVSDESPQNSPPDASFAAGCEALACAFDGSGSSDPGGGSLSYRWDFGDGATSSLAAPAHTYAAPGVYAVSLTVTDAGGLTDTMTRDVTASATPAATVQFRAAASSNTSTIGPSVRVPAQVQTGDALVLFATTNRDAQLSTPAGWTLLGVRLDGTDLESWAFTRTAQTGAAGTAVNLSLDALSKVSLTLVAYSGAGPVRAHASTGESVIQTTHRSPDVTVATAGSRVISHWVDKTGGHGGWTLPASVTARNANASSGSGALSAVTGDSSYQTTGLWSGLTATSGVASGKAISWSVVVPPS